MELDCWIGLYKIRAFPWIDGKRIYCNIQCYAPGQSVEKPPVWDKTVYVRDTPKGKKVVYEFTDSFVNYVADLHIPPNVEIVLNFEEEK